LAPRLHWAGDASQLSEIACLIFVKKCGNAFAMMSWHMVQGQREFQSINDDFRPKILRYLTRLVGENEAEDLTQIVMLKISAGLQDFRGESSLGTWIYRIATHTALDRLRGPRDGSIETHFDEDGNLPVEAEAPSAESAAIRGEMTACIREFIDHLPESYRTVMVLSELEGFRNAEVAAILGVSLDNVKIRLHRAREKLRHDLQSGCSFYRDTGDELACDRVPAVIAPPQRSR
jgi:RNA polymerase sigma-70 factor (ECF subfamily)